jgi:negative regulator of sigma E activity
MNEDMKLQLSSLMDGESVRDAERTVSDLSRSEPLRRTWRRYHLIADALCNNLPVHIDQRMVDRIAAAITNEPAVLVPRRSAWGRLLKPAAGFAIAASVTAIAILGLNQESQQPVELQLVKVVDKPRPYQNYFNRYAFPAATQVLTAPVQPTEEATPNPQLNSYLVNYNEARASQSAVQGIPPHVRIIANDEVR